MRLHTLRRSLTIQSVLIPGVAACYAVLFCMLVYDLAFHARLESWRQPPARTAARYYQGAAKLPTVTAACAEIAGMGRKLCNEESKVNVTFARVQPTVLRQPRYVRGPGQRALRIPASAPRVPASNETFPERADALHSSIASRE